MSRPHCRRQRRFGSRRLRLTDPSATAADTPHDHSHRLLRNELRPCLVRSILLKVDARCGNGLTVPLPPKTTLRCAPLPLSDSDPDLRYLVLLVPHPSWIAEFVNSLSNLVIVRTLSPLREIEWRDARAHPLSAFDPSLPSILPCTLKPAPLCPHLCSLFSSALLPPSLYRSSSRSTASSTPAGPGFRPASSFATPARA